MQRLARLVMLIALYMGVAMSMNAHQEPMPKFASKVQKAILSLNAYDKNGELMRTGNAFYITKDGVALTDYSVLKGAYSAKVIDQGGKTYDVDCILGADEAYSVVKFRVKTKGVAFIAPSQASAAKGDMLFVLPYLKEKSKTCEASKVFTADSVMGKYCYYGMSEIIDEATVGSPLMNEAGELVGIMQAKIGGKSYAMDARYMDELSIKAISTKSATLALSNIFIEKGLPETLEETLVYTYFKSRSAQNDEYLGIMNRFVAEYPDCAEAYSRRSILLTDLQRYDDADADLKKHLQLSPDKASANLNCAQCLYNKLTFQTEPKYDAWTYDIALEYIDAAAQAVTSGESAVNANQIDMLKAQILSAMKRYDDAIGVYEKWNVGETRSPSLYYAISLVREARGDSVADIIVPMDSAISMMGDPLPAEAANFIMRRANLYRAAGKWRPAVADYNTYLYLNNNKCNAQFYYDRSQLELQGRMYQQAYDDICTAVGMQPNAPLLQIEKAAICLRVGLIDESIEACNAAIALNDQLSDAYRILGYAQLQSGDKDGALKNLQHAIELGDASAQEIIDKYMK